MPLRGRNSQGSVTLALRKEQGVWMGAVFLIWKGKKNQREHFLGGWERCRKEAGQPTGNHGHFHEATLLIQCQRPLLWA